MKFIIQSIVLAIITYVACIFLPWYIVAVTGFICGYFLRSNANFLAGFIGVALAWGVNILLIEINSSSDLAERVARIFPVQKEAWLILLTLTLAGLVGGFAALAGAYLNPAKKQLINGNNKKRRN